MQTSPSRRTFLRGLGAAGTLAALGLATSASASVVGDPWQFTSSTGQASRIDFPTGWSLAQRVPLLIQFRGLNQTGDTFQRSEMAAAANGVGWAVATSAFHGNGYGSPTVMADVRALLADAAAAGVQFSGIAVWGNSMGGISALNAVTTGAVAAPVGVYLTDPVVSLRERYDSIRRDHITKAYGIAGDGSNYDSKTAGYDPALRPAADFPAVPYRVVASRGDTLVLLDRHAQVLEDKLGSARVALLDVGTSGHNTNDRFRPADLSAWLEGLPVAAPAPTPTPEPTPEPTPSPTFVADTFTTAADLAGSVTSTGAATWAVRGGGGGWVRANEVVRSGGTVGPRSGGMTCSTLFGWVEAGASDYSVETTVSGLGSGPAAQGGGLAVRVGHGTGLWLNNRVDGSTAGYALYQQTSSSKLLAKRTDVLPRVGDRLRVTVKGSTVTAFVNGTQIMQITSTLNATSTRAGLFFNRSGAASRFDDFARTA